MFMTVETLEEGQRYCIAVPKTWVNGNILKYPPGNKLLTTRKNPNSKPEASWLEMTCKPISANIKTFKEALCREKHDAQYSNTEDENEVIEMNNYRRRHPVLSQNNNEVNETSDSEQEKRITKVNIKNTINYTRKFVPKDPLDLNHLIQPKNAISKHVNKISTTGSPNLINKNHLSRLQQCKEGGAPTFKKPSLSIQLQVDQIQNEISNQKNNASAQDITRGIGECAPSMNTEDGDLDRNSQDITTLSNLRKSTNNTKETNTTEQISQKTSISGCSILKSIEIPQTTPQVRKKNQPDEIKYLREEIIHLRHEVLDSKQKLKCLNENFELFKIEQMEICASIKVTTEEILKKIYHLVIPDNVVVKDSCYIEEDDEIEWSFPIKEMSDIKSFDDKLFKNNQLKSKIMKKLIFQSSCTAVKTTRSYLKFLFDDLLLEKFSWKGTIEKESFQNLKNINEFICCAVRKHYKDYTDYIHAQELQIHLKQAKFRNKRKINKKTTLCNKKQKMVEGLSNDEVAEDDVFDEDHQLVYTESE